MTVNVLPKFKLKNKFILLKFIAFISLESISDGILNSNISFGAFI